MHEVDVSAEDSINQPYVAKLHSNTCNIVDKTPIQNPSNLACSYQYFYNIISITCPVRFQKKFFLKIRPFRPYSAIIIRCTSCIEWQLCTGYFWSKPLVPTLSNIFLTFELAKKLTPQIKIENLNYLESPIIRFLFMRNHICA